MINVIFIKEWIRRSERNVEKDFVDIGDKFISLWIAFNAWQKDMFGEAEKEVMLIEKVSNFDPMKKVFIEFKRDNKKLDELAEFRVIDRRFPDNESKTVSYNGSFESLIKSLYAIRCNLFHGRKNFDDNESDRKLVELAYYILNPLFKKYLKDKENIIN